ncbi:MAG: MMPL family transporter [Flavobacteriales bacterium]|nr:MMPL family transporter [Flavobacteriales bacterium]
MWEEHKLKRIARIGLIAIMAISVLCIWLSSQLGFDYNFENFLPHGEPETEFFFEYRSYFENDNDFMIVGLKNDEGVFQSDFLKRADSLAREIEKVAHIDTVISPTRLTEALRDPLIGTVFQKPLLRIDDNAMLQIDSTRIWDRGEMIGTLFAEDGKSIAFQIKHTQYLSKEACDTLSIVMQDLVYNSSFDEAHVVGRAIGQTYYVGVMQMEVAIFISLGLILIIIFLWISFRSAWGIWVPVTVVMLSVLWILGFMKLTGKSIDLMLIVLPTIIFVVGMSDVVHVLTKYYDELRRGKPKIEAIKVSFREIGIATFLTSLTTAIGFLTLMTSSIRPIAQFGQTTAVGVFLAYILAYTLLPAVLILSKAPKLNDQKENKIFWTRQLRKSFRWTIKHKLSIIIGSVVLIAISIFGMSRIQVNNFILEDLREGDELKKEFTYFEENFSGARPFEMAILLEDSTDIFDKDVLNQLDQVDTFLEEVYGVGTVFSPARFIKLGYRQMNGGNMRFNVIPDNQGQIDRLVTLASRYDKDSLMSLYVNQEAGVARISGKVGDLGAKHFEARNAELEQFLASEIPNAPFELRVTGTPMLIDMNNRTLAVDMTGGLIIAFLVVALIVGLMFRNVKMVLICLIPNFLPLLLIAAFMGFNGIDLKVSTSIIFTIAFGIAVDDTIHFMSKFRLELSKGRTVGYALKRTYLDTGKAIIVTSIILCGGFMTLILSDFLGTFYIGLMVSMTLVFAVFADLLLLPVLIMYFFKQKPAAIQAESTR